MKNKQFLWLGALAIVLVVLTQSFSPHEPVDTSSLPIPETAQAEVYYVIGTHYFNQDADTSGPYDLKIARQYYEAAIALDHKADPGLWYQLGRIDFIEGRFDDALERFKKQRIYFGDTLPNVWYMEGLTHGFKARLSEQPADWEAAELAFLNFLEYAPISPWARTDLAWVYFSQGKYEAMKPVLEEGLAVHKSSPWLLNMYGLAELNTGDAAAAGESFRGAQEAAANLTEADWSNAYPGNHPELWGKGLNEFRSIIATNLELAQTRSSSQP